MEQRKIRELIKYKKNTNKAYELWSTEWEKKEKKKKKEKNYPNKSKSNQ